MASRIKGITVEIGGDTTKLEQSLKAVNSTIRTTQLQLKDISRLLKLDPTNTELLSQKQAALKDAIEATKEKLEALKTAQEQAKQQMENGTLGRDKYDALQREIIETEQGLQRLARQAADANTALTKIGDAGRKLEAVGTTVTNVGRGLTRKVTSPIAAGAAVAVNKYAEVDKTMTLVNETMGNSEKQAKMLNDAMSEAETFIDNELNGYFNLLCEIIRQPGSFRELQVDLTGIEDIINKKIPETLGKNAPEDFYSLHTDFKSEYDKFRNFILYDKLIGKNIIALGGGFSSGKSSFLNVLLGDLGNLPEDTKPSTSVPTYILSGEQHELMGNNIFDATVRFELSNIKDIAYGFGRIKNEDEEVEDEVALGHILQNIFFSTPLNKYKNIAFLDTPGYSKPDSEQYSIKTDAQIARGQLNTSNYTLWFVQADSGTITEEDIKCIRSLREDIPKLIIVNKADKKNLSDLENIITKIRSNLDLKGIQYEGVYAFSCRKEQIGDERLRSFICKDEEKILKQIEAWNNEIYESNFARNFKILFMRCKDYYDQEIDNERRRLTRLNTSITRLMAEDIDMDIL